MNILDYVVIALVALWLVAAVIFTLRRRKRGGCCGAGNSCSGNCLHCSRSCACKGEPKEEEPPQRKEQSKNDRQ